MKLVLISALCLMSHLTFSKDSPMKHTLKEEIKLSETSKTVKVLAQPSFKLIGLGFKKGQILEKHKTPTAAILIVQSGAVDFIMSGKSHLLKAGDFFEIPAEVEHEVVGVEDSLLYLVK